MIRNMKMVSNILFGRGCFSQLGDVLETRRSVSSAPMVFLLDDVFRKRNLAEKLPLEEGDLLLWINTDTEPSTVGIDETCGTILARAGALPAGVIGIGGGSVLDTAKAVSVMLTNPGGAADYQGWDLPATPGVYHVGIPTLAGTGAEVSRTAVLIGPVRKLGINSDFTVFDQILLDPDLLSGAPGDQRFYTGMDCYIHCVESLRGTFLNSVSRSLAEKAYELCTQVFLGSPSSDDGEKLMTASMWGGISIAYSQVGVCHALSYGLSYVLKLHHGIANCVVFDYLDEFYPEDVKEFRRMCGLHGIELPRKLTGGVTEAQLNTMADVALSLDPLWENALGIGWKGIMTRERVKGLLKRM
jgi:3-deoxy-alpha-D-manno-octulosonate 8-oxidase